METSIFGWWWRSHQSLAHNGLRIFRFCVMPWKDEREPKVQHCMGGRIDVVQKFTRIQSFRQNWRWSNGIRVEYLPRIHHIGALHQSPRVTVKIERNTRQLHRTDHLHVDVQRHLMGSIHNKKECESSAQFVSLYAKRFGAGQWSFLGPGSEKKWYSISGDSPQGEWDRIAEQMMLTFAESTHPVFRSTSPLSRGAQKQRRWKIINTLLCRWWYDWNCFSHNFCQSAQYLRSIRRNVWRMWLLPW